MRWIVFITMLIQLLTCFADSSAIPDEEDLPWIDPESAVYDYTVKYREDSTFPIISGDFSFTIYFPSNVEFITLRRTRCYRKTEPEEKDPREYLCGFLIELDKVIDGKYTYKSKLPWGTYFYCYCNVRVGDEIFARKSNVICNTDYLDQSLIDRVTSVESVFENIPDVTIDGNNIVVKTDHQITIQIYDLNGSCIKSVNVSENCEIPLDTLNSRMSVIEVLDNNEVISISKVLPK
jgi:hypothetical protein